jgi:predicted aldo/keto reductase-like oxidoreductase
LDECLAAAKDSAITPKEQEYLAALYNSEMMFCQRCNTCTSQCPKGLPIPDIMRAYMYTYGYKHATLSKETLAGLDVAQNACDDCSECKVNCPSGFNVSKKIAAIMPVVQVPTEFLT